MSRAGDLRVRLSGSRHAVPTMVSNRDPVVTAKQIGQFVTLATALPGRLRGLTMVKRAAPPGLEQHLVHLDWAVLAGPALTQLALLQHQQRGGASGASTACREGRHEAIEDSVARCREASAVRPRS